MAYSLPRNDGGQIREDNTLGPLLAACAATIVLWFLPYASYLTYPIRLLVTFLHEGGHALAALLTGGMVARIGIAPDGSGFTETLGGMNLLIVSSGYLGATLYGAALIALVRRRVSGRALLVATALFVGLLTIGFIRPWNNPFGFGWGVGLTAALVLASRFLAPRSANFAAAFVGVQCALNALFDLRTLLQLSWGQPSGAVTDAHIISRMIPLPPVIWALFWIALAFALLFLVLRPRRRAATS